MRGWRRRRSGLYARDIMRAGNVQWEVRDADGRLVDKGTASNSVTAAGKSWALKKWIGDTTVASQHLNACTMELNVAGSWTGATIASDGRTRDENVVTVVATYSPTTPNPKITQGRIRVGTMDYATVTFDAPGPVVGQGATLTVTWTLRCGYFPAITYDDDEVTSIVDQHGNTLRQLWVGTTDVPRVESKFMGILWNAPGETRPNKITHGRLEVFTLATDTMAIMGPFAIRYNSTTMGTFSVNEELNSLDFAFNWQKPTFGTGINNESVWYYMTFNDVATGRLTSAVRYDAGYFIGGHQDTVYPESARGFVTGIQLSLT